jgi:hypothetical protein
MCFASYGKMNIASDKLLVAKWYEFFNTRTGSTIYKVGTGQPI